LRVSKHSQRIIDWVRVGLLLLYPRLKDYFPNISKITNGFYVKGDFYWKLGVVMGTISNSGLENIKKQK